MSVFKLLLSPQGRIGRKSYWLFVAISIGVGFLGGVIDGFIRGFTQAATGAAPASGTGVFAALASLLMIYPNICVSAKRLHDTGRSGWWQVLPGPPMIGAMIVAGLMGPEGTDSVLLNLAIILLALVIVASVVVLVVWLGILKGDAGPNRFGEPNSGDRAVAPVAEVFN